MMEGHANEWRLNKQHKRLLGDREAMRILESTMHEAKPAMQIILESNIAQSTAYRKIKRLTNLSLLRIEFNLNYHGRWEMRYRTNTSALLGRSMGD